MREDKTVNSKELWKLHVDLLQYVDLIEKAPLRKLLKTRILDVAHAAKESLEEYEGGN